MHTQHTHTDVCAHTHVYPPPVRFSGSVEMGWLQADPVLGLGGSVAATHHCSKKGPRCLGRVAVLSLLIQVLS